MNFFQQYPTQLAFHQSQQFQNQNQNQNQHHPHHTPQQQRPPLPSSPFLPPVRRHTLQPSPHHHLHHRPHSWSNHHHPAPMASIDETSPEYQQHAPPLRQRLDTEETEVIRNGGAPCTTPVSKHSRDDFSVVSSLSNDEDSLIVAQRQAMMPSIVETQQKAEPPPTEVAFPVKDRDNMERLVSRLSLQKQSPPPVVTHGPSPVAPRPTLGRFHSSPRLDFLSAPPPVVPDNNAIVVNGQFVRGVAARNPDPFTQTAHGSQLLAGRKRRQLPGHYRSHSATTISVGSLVGQSSLVTAPTMSSGSEAESYSGSSVLRSLQQTHLAQRKLSKYTGADDGIACCQTQSRRRGNVVREEVKYILGKVSGPIRNLPLLKKKEVDLKRASGTLA